MKETLIIAGMILAIVIGTGLIAYTVKNVQCTDRAELMKREYSFAMLTGCMIKKPDGSYIPLNNLREFDD